MRAIVFVGFIGVPPFLETTILLMVGESLFVSIICR